MRILITSNYHISSYHGGNEVYTDQLASGLASLGHEVIYVTSAPAKKDKFPYQLITFNTFRVAGHLVPTPQWLSPRLPPLDVLHSTGSGLPIITLAATTKANLKVNTFQGDSNPKSIISKHLSKTLVHATIKTHDLIITTTPYSRQILKHRYPNTSIEHIPLAYPDHSKPVRMAKTQAKKHLALEASTSYVLYVGKLDQHHYYKGLDFLITAMSKVSENCKLIIVGEGPLKVEYQNLAVKLGVNQKTIFAGYVDNQNMPYYYKAADVFVLPSISDSEGFGLVILEAMLQKTAVITTTAIASADWFGKNHTVILVSPQQPDQLSAAINENLRHPDNKMIQNAFEFALKHDRHTLIEETVKTYRQHL